MLQHRMGESQNEALWWERDQGVTASFLIIEISHVGWREVVFSPPEVSLSMLLIDQPKLTWDEVQPLHNYGILVAKRSGWWTCRRPFVSILSPFFHLALLLAYALISRLIFLLFYNNPYSPESSEFNTAVLLSLAIMDTLNGNTNSVYWIGGNCHVRLNKLILICVSTFAIAILSTLLHEPNLLLGY